MQNREIWAEDIDDQHRLACLTINHRYSLFYIWPTNISIGRFYNTAGNHWPCETSPHGSPSPAKRDPQVQSKSPKHTWSCGPERNKKYDLGMF